MVTVHDDSGGFGQNAHVRRHFRNKASSPERSYQKYESSNIMRLTVYPEARSKHVYATYRIGKRSDLSRFLIYLTFAYQP